MGDTSAEGDLGIQREWMSLDDDLGIVCDSSFGLCNVALVQLNREIKRLKQRVEELEEHPAIRDKL